MRFPEPQSVILFLQISVVVGIFLCGAKRASGRAKANLGAANWRVKFVLQARTLEEL